MTLSCCDIFCVNYSKTLCSESGPTPDMQISEAAGGVPAPGVEPCRFPKLEECAHFHYERVQLLPLQVALQTNMDQSLHSQHTNEDDTEWFMVQVTSAEECWLVQRNFENFRMLDQQLHQCIFDRKISQLEDLEDVSSNEEDLEQILAMYLERLSQIADNSVNCGPVLNWLQMDNKGHRLLVPSEESRSINTPAVAAAYSVRRYVSQARDELNLEVGDMISVIDMASPGESMWWRGKRGFQVGFFPQHCVHIIGDKVPRNMPLPPPVVGSLALTTVKPVLRRHGKLVTFFRGFLLNRPSRRRLKQSGILRERVFGCDLGEHLLNSGKAVPTVLKSCAEFIEAKGIVDGIYRLSGITSNIQKLRNAFDEDRVPDLYTEDILKDIHSVASLLKMYFRELPNPLCTYQLYQSFVNAVQGCGTAIRTTETDHERLLKMREAVQKLPPPHYRTLEYLMRHLARVANYSGSTGMTTRNLAIVWAPNLLRCEALEVGGVAALQGVGVQAVVTEFLICYADLIFSDHLPNIDQPDLADKENLLAKKCRPNSLAISTPTKLITLEEARNKHLSNKTEDCNYIEVGGGPSNLPKKYHTIIDLPPGTRKRGHTKRSPLGWRMFFTRSSRNSDRGSVNKNRKASTPITINDKSVTESDLTDMRRKLRTVKSAESLTSGHSEPANTEDVLGPLHSLIKPPGHNRSVSHDSYFDNLQTSRDNSEGSLLDLSEIHLNFDLEESEMRIFSEDESLVSSPRIQRDSGQKRILSRARPEEFTSAGNSVNPSPKKQARAVLSPDTLSRKRTRLEDQLSDIQYIDCGTPDNLVSTTAVIHPTPNSPKKSEPIEPKRQSLNLDNGPKKYSLTKSFTDVDINRQFVESTSVLTTPGSPRYQRLGDSTSTGYESSPSEITYQNLHKSDTDSLQKASTPNYENILTTISITYKSPPRSASASPLKSPEYENVILNPEKVEIPTSTASLPVQEASQPDLEERPRSFSGSTDSTTVKAMCSTSEQLSLTSLNDQRSASSNRSSGSNIQYTASLSSTPYQCMENSSTDLSLSEVVQSPTDSSQTSISTPQSPSKSPNVSPSTDSRNDILLGSPVRSNSQNDKRKSDDTESYDENAIYQQVKYFRRSIHEVNALLSMENDEKPEDKNDGQKEAEDEADGDSLEEDCHVYENVDAESMKSNEKTEERCNVKDLMSRFEDAGPKIVNESKPEEKNSKPPKLRVFYEKDILPPCLRARNLKNQLKTRSLDENEFEKECGLMKANQRRKSMEENVGYKTNSLPKTLNLPKTLPKDEPGQLESIHLGHSAEKLPGDEKISEDEEQKKRERIEKYKEERRKILSEKFRSESFKEDKEVLMSRLKIYKVKDDVIDTAPLLPPKVDSEKPPRVRRISNESKDSDTKSSTPSPKKEAKTQNTGSLKVRAAIFEQNQKVAPVKMEFVRNNKEKDKSFGRFLEKSDKSSLDDIADDLKELEFIRHKRRDMGEEERRRHTYETRERETDLERQRRVSLESRNSPRKERASPTYCIKDMKAIFESKCKQ
ncbi:GTPase-activating protein CdGAPr isoform X2 [Sitophilus oryzae]|uniref:GTPase-activating protein CdGAPr isoform X2 n=1 Tax=Sitophilus oryzae TaxID=7048 RepID=A0A6J2XWK8_SITOR|nr:GTPase-activating protein CdGAPr isoform X2 [Sitophilus oryzae]